MLLGPVAVKVTSQFSRRHRTFPRTLAWTFVLTEPCRFTAVQTRGRPTSSKHPRERERRSANRCIRKRWLWIIKVAMISEVCGQVKPAETPRQRDEGKTLCWRAHAALFWDVRCWVFVCPCVFKEIGGGWLSVGEELINASPLSHWCTKARVHAQGTRALLPSRVEGIAQIKFVWSVFNYFHFSYYTIGPGSSCLLRFYLPGANHKKQFNWLL